MGRTALDACGRGATRLHRLRDARGGRKGIPWAKGAQVNLAHLIDQHEADRVALISRSRPTTYGALRDQVAHVRGGLAALGVERGDRVVLLCGNGRYFVLAYLATIGLGAVAVPLNPASPSPEIEREIAKVGAKLVVVEPAAAHAWNGVDRSAVPSVVSVIATEGGAIDGSVELASLLDGPTADIVEVEPGDVAVLMFTSGTAGAPRAAMLSHGNLLANLEQGRSANVQIDAHDVVYGVLPLFHIFGLNVVLGLSLPARRHGGARPAVRPVHRPRHHPRARRHRRARRAAAVARVQPLRRGPRRQLRHRAPRAHRRGDACRRRP